MCCRCIDDIIAWIYINKGEEKRSLKLYFVGVCGDIRMCLSELLHKTYTCGLCHHKVEKRPEEYGISNHHRFIINQNPKYLNSTFKKYWTKVHFIESWWQERSLFNRKTEFPMEKRRREDTIQTKTMQRKNVGVLKIAPGLNSL